MRSTYSCAITTPFGEAVCALTQTGAVTELKLAPVGDDACTSVEQLPAVVQQASESLRTQLAEYFAGQRREFELSLDPQGTEFQRRVWTELQRIPYGTTISYGELARRLGDPKAVRAVGRANGLNPIWIVIPCHRVVGADGSLTGYGAGIEVKRRLLELEGAIAPRLFD